MLVDTGKLTPLNVEAVLSHHRDRSLPFGAAAVELGLVSEADVQEVLARQFDYRYLRKGESAILQEVRAAYQPFSAQVEELRALRSQLMLRCFQPSSGAAKLLVVASVGRGDGRSYLAANLAVVFSQLGQRTLLVDADLRHPRQHALFGLEQDHGLSTYLAGRGNLSAIQKIRELGDLSVLVAGPVPPNPQELLSRTGLAALLSGVQRDHDVVIVDTSATELGADAVALAARATHALLVARQDRTQLSRLQTLSEEIVAAGARVVGCVLNRHAGSGAK
jgi:chain length determinant protein tyrosine kinase EpsG